MTLSVRETGPLDADLRGAMAERSVEQVTALGLQVPATVQRAIRAVPRHLFTEEASLEDAYGDGVVITDRAPDGSLISSVTATWLQAAQLCQAGLAEGDCVLEIGSGGYNAALAWEIVGPSGSVTSIDIEPAVVERAQRCLDTAGYSGVEVICGNGDQEAIPGRTFDAIIVTAGAWDISPAWLTQLANDGRLIVPLRTMSVTRSWELHRTGTGLISRSHLACGFLRMRGDGHPRGRSVPLNHEPAVGLWCDEGQDQGMNEAQLLGVLDQPRTEIWIDVEIAAGQGFSNQDLWLATRLPGYCHITASPDALASGIVDLRWEYGQPAFVAQGATVAYRPTCRPLENNAARKVFGAFAHGPDASSAARLLADQIMAWDRAQRPSPVLHVFPAGTPDTDLPEGFVVEKQKTRLVIAW